ncbi:hypothetical protein [Clavibacter tessellarius]|uniref:hypothetical protein n=1 Tax=Clavibacter tessellarius TaxID=31965 RepID=UPI00324F4E11
MILEAVGDPAVARAVLLIGDGLYYNSALQPWLGGSAPADSALDEAHPRRRRPGAAPLDARLRRGISPDAPRGRPPQQPPSR